MSKDITAKTGNFEALWLNNGVAPFNDVAVRKAVAYAVDRAAIVQRLFGAPRREGAAARPQRSRS